MISELIYDVNGAFDLSQTPFLLSIEHNIIVYICSNFEGILLMLNKT